MSALATTLVSWDALWKIVTAALIGGAGIVIAFGLALIGLQGAKAARGRSARLAHRSLTGTCGLICIGAVAIGIYAMVEKPATKSKSAGIVSPAPSARPPN